LLPLLLSLSLLLLLSLPPLLLLLSLPLLLLLPSALLLALPLALLVFSLALLLLLLPPWGLRASRLALRLRWLSPIWFRRRRLWRRLADVDCLRCSGQVFIVIKHATACAFKCVTNVANGLGATRRCSRPKVTRRSGGAAAAPRRAASRRQLSCVVIIGLLLLLYSARLSSCQLLEVFSPACLPGFQVDVHAERLDGCGRQQKYICRRWTFRLSRKLHFTPLHFTAQNIPRC
jgi:hypothetical protein